MNVKRSFDRSDPALLEARQKAAWRRRPLILDDDGDVVYVDETFEGGPEALLEQRIGDCLDMGVDSYAWCIMWGIAKQGKTPTRYWQTQMQGIDFQENMPDPTAVVADYCRKNNIEVFGSIRMNDCHDAFGHLPFPKLTYPLKVKHPEMLLGDESQRGTVHDGLAAAMWSGLNFAYQEVRDDRLWWIENTARSYDVDGVDLNLFRMPWYFKLDEVEKNMPLMTELVREARRRLDEIGRRRGRPVLLGVRVPDTLETCNLIGLDIETWLRERLVDRMLTGSGWMCYSAHAEELVELGHRFEVPVYPCIECHECPNILKLGGGTLRGAATNLWSSGADGLYIFNFWYLPAPGTRRYSRGFGSRLGHGRTAPEIYNKYLKELADPEGLKYLDKSFAVHVRGWEQYQRACAPAPLPAVFQKHEGQYSCSVPVRIGDDIADALCKGKLRDIVLRLQLSDGVADDLLVVTFNDAQAKTMMNDDGMMVDYHSLEIEPRAVRQGVNQIKVDISRCDISVGRPLSIENVRVDVRYR
jgi:hypothetical protein